MQIKDLIKYTEDILVSEDNFTPPETPVEGNELTYASSLKDEEIQFHLGAIAKLRIYVKKFEDLYSSLTEEALKRKIPDSLLPVLEMKYEIKPGNSFTEINVSEIFKNIPIEKFLKVISFVDSKAKTELTPEEYSVVEANKKTKLSEKNIVSVRAMNKKELKESGIST